MSGEPPFEKPLTTAADWEARWVAHDTPWDMGDVSPPVRALAAAGALPGGARVLVPGCGAGYDLGFLAARGYEVTGVDVAPHAIERAREVNAGVEGVRLVEADALDTDRLTPLSFDWVLEQTFFCALDPELRPAYGRAMRRWLKAEGELLAILMRTPYHDRQPYDVPVGDYLGVVEGMGFEVVENRALQEESHPARRGRETLVRLRKIAELAGT